MVSVRPSSLRISSRRRKGFGWVVSLMVGYWLDLDEFEFEFLDWDSKFSSRKGDFSMIFAGIICLTTSSRRLKVFRDLARDLGTSSGVRDLMHLIPVELLRALLARAGLWLTFRMTLELFLLRSSKNFSFRSSFKEAWESDPPLSSFSSGM